MLSRATRSPLNLAVLSHLHAFAAGASDEIGTPPRCSAAAVYAAVATVNAASHAAAL